MSDVPSATLNWDSSRGFELDLTATRGDVTVRMVTVPVPADGTIELRAEPIELDRLEILFKAQVQIDEEPGQLAEARVHIASALGNDLLVLDAKVEDVETGDFLPFAVQVPVAMPHAPASGGPRPSPTSEDELDWDDEDTLSRMFGGETVAAEVPTTPPPPAPTGNPEAGLDALLKALATLDPSADTPSLEAATEEPTEEVPLPVSTEDPVEDGSSPTDQTLAPEVEARRFLELLVGRDDLELEEDYTVQELAEGAAPILSLPFPPGRMASTLSSWLLEQDAVADLYIDDDDLASLLAEW